MRYNLIILVECSFTHILVYDMTIRLRKKLTRKITLQMAFLDEEGSRSELQKSDRIPRSHIKLSLISLEEIPEAGLTPQRKIDILTKSAAYCEIKWYKKEISQVVTCSYQCFFLYVMGAVANMHTRKRLLTKYVNI